MTKLLLVVLAVALARPLAADESIRFNRDVRPVLSENCFKCHGPDSAKRVAKLRLDDPASALSELGGRRAIVPGKPGESELVRRIRAGDPDERMPPPDSGLALSPAQMEILERWIASGAAYEKHWALLPPELPPLAAVRDPSWARQPSDRFVLARLEREGLRPSAEAAPETLIRRLSLDLTGLPPEIDDVDRFLADGRPDGYERLADRLLASPRYGERMALEWLDAARYADTNGYQGDSTRTLWHWRDWLIRALNADLPFDRFTIEQLAGDLLPDATQEQRIATGFHRNHMLNGEGGRIAEESRVEYVMDRVETTAAVWMALTLNCARCHDHKYDPLTQREYYQLYAFFNNVPESGGVDAGGNANPILRITTPEIEDELAALAREAAAAEAEIETPSPEEDAAQAAWEAGLAEVSLELSPWMASGPYEEKDFDAAFDAEFPPERAAEAASAAEAGAPRWTAREDWVDGKVHPLSGSNCATYLLRTIRAERETPATLSLGSDDGLKVWLNGKLVFAKKLVRGAAPDQDQVGVRLERGENRLLLKVVNQTGGYGFYFKLRDAGPPPEIIALARSPAERRSEAERRRLRSFYRTRVSERFGAASARLAAARARRQEIEAALPATMVMAELPQPRPSAILVRGAYDKPGEPVSAGVPAALPPLPAGAPANRLGLARWLVAPEHPLTSRVLVNRAWELFFGRALVKTTEDLGSQSEPPSHPELLDHLARRFASDWDVKALHRRLVASAAYRQSSRVDAAVLERDPANRLLACGPRRRLSSLLLRDQALALSGLLVERLGGPPVRPYQPAGIWEEFSFGQISYRPDQGESLYRRSLYTFWRRSVGPTMFFDVSARQVCTVGQTRTNTPLHALVLLNETGFVEAARGFAARMLRRPEPPAARLAWAFRAAVSRRPEPEEIEVLVRALERLVSEYRGAPAEAEALLSVGESKPAADLDPVELAAYAGVASLILNLDEVMNVE